jgi:hypothetical protein
MISAREPIGSRDDIWTRADKGYDMKNDIDGKASNNILEAVNKLALSARLDHSCETGWNKHDSSYYSKQNSKFYYRVKF